MGEGLLGVPDVQYCLLHTMRLASTNEKMLTLSLATFNVHEFVELQYPALATCPTLASFMEQGLAWMVNAFLFLPV